ncbi:MAG: fluoride efflux transporter CrcB [Oscillospiraceae bacterium]|nr:fluoride efflux transporter CrcB [Oscillospiraceae bacterium]
MLNCCVVGAGGFVGAVLRYLLGLVPIKTLVVNIIGCFVIGIIAGLAEKPLAEYPRLVLFLKVGICGGFTTFSSFALETGDLMSGGRYAAAAAYALASAVLGIAAVFLGQYLIKSIILGN